MGKRRERAKPESRAKTRGAVSRAPLLVLAGLPEATAEAAAQTVNKDGASPWRAVSVPFPARHPFYDADVVGDLAAQVLAYAMERDLTGEELVDPTRVVLAYVEADATAPLWEGFGHSAWPVRMSYPDWEWPNGQHWRFDIDAVMAMVRRALATAQSDWVTDLRLRMEARRRDDPLLLPARNFMVEPATRLNARFRGLLEDDMAQERVAALDQEVVRRKFPFKHLSRFYTETGGQNKSFAVDCRDLVFAKAQVGQHGAHHDIEADADLNTARIRRELEGRFRFGTPVQPPGFQHDVQREFGVNLAGERMYCATRGEAYVWGDHANVFANDVLTADQVQEVE